MAIEIIPLIQRALVIGFSLFLFGLMGYFLGLQKPFILMKYKKKMGDAKMFIATLNKTYPPSPTMDNDLREERVRQMIKSGYPMVVLEKAQKLVAQDIIKINKEANKNGLQLHKRKSTGTKTDTTTDTNSTTDTRTTNGNGNNGRNKEPQQPGVLPISSTPIISRDKPKLKWDWNSVKSNRTKP